MGHHVIVALGANLPGRFGPPRAAVGRAMEALGPALGARGTAASSAWRTPAWPAGSGPDYVNAVLRLDGVTLVPGAILERLHRLEAEAGRTRAERWAPRPLDLDLLAVGDLVEPDAATQTARREADPLDETPPEGLVLPHPRMEGRAFVLAPMAEVAPGWRHPLTGATVAGMLAALPAAEREAVARLD